MTNYEWLVKSGELEDFFCELIETDDTFPLSEFERKWNIPQTTYLHSRNISNWLQAERKTKEYVKLVDVLAIITDPITKKEAIDDIKKLPRKEIDDNV